MLLPSRATSRRPVLWPATTATWPSVPPQTRAVPPVDSLKNSRTRSTNSNHTFRIYIIGYIQLLSRTTGGGLYFCLHFQLEAAENRIRDLEGCECSKTCHPETGERRDHGETWNLGCEKCSCSVSYLEISKQSVLIRGDKTSFMMA